MIDIDFTKPIYESDFVKESRTMSDVAKHIDIPGLGRNNLFKFLRENDVLDYNNIPFDRYIDIGYFEVKIPYNKNKDDYIPQTFITPLGVNFIRNLIS